MARLRCYVMLKGAVEFEDDSTKTLMMLPTDMALVVDKRFKSYVDKHAAYQDLFFNDFSTVLTNLFELGVSFVTGEDARMKFRRRE